MEHHRIEAIFSQSLRLVEIGRCHFAEVDAEQRTHPREYRVQAGGGERTSQPSGQPGRGGGQSIKGSVVEEFQRGPPCRHRQRVPGQGASLVHASQRREVLHHVPPASEGSDREASADDLAETPQVRSDTEPLSRPAPSQTEPGDDLVEDEQSPDGVAGQPQTFKEPGGRRDKAHVGGYRLDNDRGHRVVQVGQHVVGTDDGVGHRPGGDPVAPGQTLVSHAAASSCQ